MRKLMVLLLVCSVLGCNTAEYEPKNIRDLGTVEYTTFHQGNWTCDSKTTIVTSKGSYMVYGAKSCDVGAKVEELDRKYIKVYQGDYWIRYKMVGR